MSPNANVAFVVVRLTHVAIGLACPTRTNSDYSDLTAAKAYARKLSKKSEEYAVMTGAEFDALRYDHMATAYTTGTVYTGKINTL